MQVNTSHSKIVQILSQDSKLASILPLVNLPNITAKPDIYPELLRAIAGQQLSTKAAATIYARFESLYGNACPTPEILRQTPIEDLRSIGLSGQKSQYLHNIAETFIQNNWLVRDWQKSNDQTIIAQLCTIKGVGEWTVQMILMFALARPNVFPIKDLGVRQAMIKLYQPKAETNKILLAELEEIAQKWAPFRSYACHALWQWKDSKP